MHIEQLDDVEFRPDGGEPIGMSRVGYAARGWGDRGIDPEPQPIVTGAAVPWRRLRPLVGRDGDLVVTRKGRERARFRARLIDAGQYMGSLTNALFLRLRMQEASRP